MAEYAIIPSSEGLKVQIYDAPASGWRSLFVERDGEIGNYIDRGHAEAGIEIYSRADKTIILEAELAVYQEAVRTGKSLGECGLQSIVHFGDQDHHPYATFILPEDFIRKSNLKIIGYKIEDAIYSAGWEETIFGAS
jgi:hypothetical protein